MSEAEIRDNSGDRRLLRLVACASCGKPLEAEPAYAARRAGPAFFYSCVECEKEHDKS